MAKIVIGDDYEGTKDFFGNMVEKARFDFFALTKHPFEFFGACNNQFKVDAGVYEILEDPDDGYRSYMHGIMVPDSKEIFLPISVAKVKFIKIDVDTKKNSGDWDAERFTGYGLEDLVDGHIWLKFGTNRSSDWYPCFVFRYNAKERK